MYAVLAGFVLLLLVLWGSRYFATADAGNLARTIKRYSWVGLFILAGLFIIPGLLILAIPLALAGYTMLRKQGGFSLGGGGYGGPYGTSQRRSGQKSYVRTSHLEMELDHDTGRVDGRCVAGPFAGRPLSSLAMEELKELVLGLQQGDPQEAALIEAYLNQRFPGWQEGPRARGGHSSGGASRGGSSGNGSNGRRARASSSMSVDEAYEVLGVARGATKDEIRSAHRQLMKRVHPDQGGSTYLAARINEAKEVLLSVR